MSPIKFHLAVAAAIALTAFAIGQAFPGMGLLFAIPASSLWAAWSVRRARLAG
ncbi:MAG TPA: hypothetical protein VF548_13110 [Allosphingosinicella sp.]|jgi:hypothetical protein